MFPNNEKAVQVGGLKGGLRRGEHGQGLFPAAGGLENCRPHAQPRAAPRRASGSQLLGTSPLTSERPPRTGPGPSGPLVFNTAVEYQAWLVGTQFPLLDK